MTTSGADKLISLLQATSSEMTNPHLKAIPLHYYYKYYYLVGRGGGGSRISLYLCPCHDRAVLETETIFFF